MNLSKGKCQPLILVLSVLVCSVFVTPVGGRAGNADFSKAPKDTWSEPDHHTPPLTIEGKKVKYMSESSNYRYSVTYPNEVTPEQLNKIEITIFNKSNLDDKILSIENRDITKGDGASLLLQNWDEAGFRILKAEPKPNKLENMFGSTYLDYDGLKAGEGKKILLYFKITTLGNFIQKLMFYTDKHRNEEYELISVLTIKCKE